MLKIVVVIMVYLILLLVNVNVKKDGKEPIVIDAHYLYVINYFKYYGI